MLISNKFLDSLGREGSHLLLSQLGESGKVHVKDNLPASLLVTSNSGTLSFLIVGEADLVFTFQERALTEKVRQLRQIFKVLFVKRSFWD